MRFYLLFLFLIVFLVIFNGCTDISARSTQPDTLVSFISDSNYESSIITTEENEDTVINSEFYNTYTFSEDEENFISRLVFVGDSICKGLSGYGILAESQVIAQGNVAAGNILDFKFSDNNSGGEFDVLTALVNASSDFIILSMGMNDLNITDIDDFCENYINFISMIKTYCSDSIIVTLSITPVCETNKFTENSTIILYNAALKTAIDDLYDNSVYFLDIDPELKNTAGYLKNKYTSGDGIHLTETAYYAILKQICNMGLYIE